MRRAKVGCDNRLRRGRTIPELRPRKCDVLVHTRRVGARASGRGQLVKMRVIGARVVHLEAQAEWRSTGGVAGKAVGVEVKWVGGRANAIILARDGTSASFFGGAVYLNSGEWAFSRQ